MSCLQGHMHVRTTALLLGQRSTGWRVRLQVCSFKPPENAVHLAFSADSRSLLVDMRDRTLAVYALHTDTLLVRSACQASTGAARSRTFDAPGGALRAHLKPPRVTTVEQLRIRPALGGKNGAFVATGTSQGKVRLWHWPSETHLRDVKGHTGPVNCVTWSPTDPQLIVTASDDGTVRVWGPAEQSGVAELGSGAA
jgi:WD40 repeat protein